MDPEAMSGAYQRAIKHIPTPNHEVEYRPMPRRYDDYIVVHKTDGTYAICRSRNEQMFEYEELGVVRYHHEAMDIAKLLNEREGNK